jgi:hypothetical protein
MADQNPAPRRSNPWFLAVWIGLALLTLYFAFTGWMARAEAFEARTLWRAIENAAFLSLHAFGFSEAYVSPERVGGEWRLLIARWMGAALFVSAAGAATFAVFESHIATLRSALTRRHTLIIGDHEMAFALVAEGLRRRLHLVHVSDAADRVHAEGRLISLPRSIASDPLALGHAERARRVIVAERDLGASAELALEARSRFEAGEAGRSIVAVHLDDPPTAELIHHVAGGIDLFAFSEAQAAARCVLARHPPFLLARAISAPSVHVLIVGFNWLGQALAKDLVLTSLVSDQGRPLITVIDPDPRAARDFLHRHPEFTAICDFEAVHDLEDGRLAAPASAANPAVCAAYICLDHSAEALAAAVTLRERSVRYEAMQGPIFVRLRSGGLLPAPGGVAALKPLRLYGFASLNDAVTGSRALLDDPDAAARSVHAGYSGVAASAGVDWGALPEEMRISNRRVVAHVPAKLASLGFDLEPWLCLPEETRSWPMALDPDEPLFRDEDDRRATAILEHRRWAADRQLNGWRFGAVRDDRRKHHPDLIPFEDLSEAVQAHDYKIADWLDTYLPRAPGGLTRATAGRRL